MSRFICRALLRAGRNPGAEITKSGRTPAPDWDVVDANQSEPRSPQPWPTRRPWCTLARAAAPYSHTMSAPQLYGTEGQRFDPLGRVKQIAANWPVSASPSEQRIGSPGFFFLTLIDSVCERDGQAVLHEPEVWCASVGPSVTGRFSGRA